MLESFLTTTAQHGQRSSVNEFNEVQYSYRDILCRIERKTKLVRTRAGEEVLSDTTVYTAVSVAAGDVINAREVIAAEVWTDINGRNCGYKLYLK